MKRFRTLKGTAKKTTRRQPITVL